MNIEELIIRLCDDEYSADEQLLLREAIAQQDAITPALLEIVERDTARFDHIESHPGYCGHIYAIFLLAQFREPRAYPLIVRFFSVPRNNYYIVFGDMITEDLAEIFASVYDGDDAPLYGLIENANAYEFCRNAALDAFVHLVRMGLKSRGSVLEYVKELLTFRLEKVESATWSGAIDVACNLAGTECMPAIRKAFGRGLIDPMCATIEDIETDMSRDPAMLLREFRPYRSAPITDVCRMFADWARQRETNELREEQRRQERLFESAGILRSTPALPPEPEPEYTTVSSGTIHRTTERVLPNDPCPCESGRKYKKCCGRLA